MQEYRGLFASLLLLQEGQSSMFLPKAILEMDAKKQFTINIF